MSEKKIICYMLTLESYGGWLFLGTTPEDVGRAFTEHLREHEGMDADEIDPMRIKAVELTQDEIDNLPDFPGW